MHGNEKLSDISRLRMFDARQVSRWLDYPGCIVAVRTAMTAFTGNGEEQPLRSILPVGPAKLFALMPGFSPIGASFGAKVITAFADPDHPGRSTHRGVIVLFERDRGELMAIVDAGEVTHIRTAAASAVATDALARPDVRSLAIFGYGAQAASHAKALCLVRDFDRVIIWGRNEEAGRAFASQVSDSSNIEAVFVADPETAASQADVICTVTGSSEPILRGAWVRPGTHVNLVGSSHAAAAEADHDLVSMSRFIADSRRSALAAAGEFLNAKAAGIVDETHIVAEIGEVLLGRVVGRENASQVTVYKSLGHIVQDLAAADYVRRAADAGQILPSALAEPG